MQTFNLQARWNNCDQPLVNTSMSAPQKQIYDLWFSKYSNNNGWKRQIFFFLHLVKTLPFKLCYLTLKFCAVGSQTLCWKINLSFSSSQNTLHPIKLTERKNKLSSSIDIKLLGNLQRESPSDVSKNLDTQYNWVPYWKLLWQVLFPG